MLFGEQEDEIAQHGEGDVDIGGLYGLGGVVADPASAADEKHGDGTERGDRDGVVSGTTRKGENA
jgi:hypothetical protein